MPSKSAPHWDGDAQPTSSPREPILPCGLAGWLTWTGIWCDARDPGETRLELSPEGLRRRRLVFPPPSQNRIPAADLHAVPAVVPMANISKSRAIVLKESISICKDAGGRWRMGESVMHDRTFEEDRIQGKCCWR